MCYDLIPRKDKEGSTEVPLEFLGLLSQYGDVISDNVSKVLPLIRKIGHQIDLILGAHFSNKASHRMTPTETKDLKKQVQELLRKGLI